MTVDFSDYFWGDKNNGFDVLYHNMKYGLVASKELTEFLRERSNIEENNSKLLGKLAKQAGGGCMQGTFAPLWQVLRSTAEKLASIHLQMVQKVADLVKDVSKYADELQKKHKTVKDEEGGTLEVVQAIQSTSATLQKAKDTYNQKVIEYEKLKRENASPRDLEKAEVKLRKAQEDYKALVEKYSVVKEDFEKKMSQACKHFQEVEEDHLKHMKEFLNTYADLVEANHDLIGQVHVDFKRQCLEMTVENLLEQFVRNKYTGVDKPGAKELEEVNIGLIGDGSLIAASREPGDRLPSSSSLGNTASGNSETIINRMKREGQGQAPNRQSSDSLSPTISYSSLTAWTTGFLKSRRKRKEKTAKKKKDGTPDNASNKDDKSDNEEKEDTGNKSKTPTPDVDDEGYCIRPKIENWENDKNSFYSSSDTDSDDERERKIHVEIKPLSTGAGPMSASVDELRATVENLSLCPIAILPVGQNLAEKVNSRGDYIINDEDYCSNTEFLFKEVTDNDILRTVLELRGMTAPGHDGISTKIFKQHIKLFVKPLKYIYNMSISQGIFPDTFKIAKHFPLFKNGDKSEKSNYRPISLLSVFSKVLEKIVKHQLSDYIETNNILTSKQFGFRKKNSDALFSLTQEIDQASSYLPLSKKVNSDLVDLNLFQSATGSSASTPTSSHPYAPLQSPTLINPAPPPPVSAPPTSCYADLGDIFSEVGEIQALPTKHGPGMSRQIPTPTSSIVIPRPPSRRGEGRGRISPSASTQGAGGIIARADSIGSLGSLEFRTAGVSIGSSRGPSPLTIGMADTIPLAVAFHEIIHSYFRGTDETKCQVKLSGDMMVSFPAGIVAVLANNPNPAQLTFRVRNSGKLENVLPNTQLVSLDSSQTTNENSVYDFNMCALTSLLRRQSEQNPSASYFNVDILKYQIKSKCGAGSCPFQLVAYWKCETNQTDLKIDYKYNSHAMASPSPLLNLTVTVPVNGNVKSVQSKPTAHWINDSQRAVWKLTELSQHSENHGVGSLRARCEVSDGPSSQNTISAQFNCEGTTLSGAEFELIGAGYRLSLVKRRFVSGKYICDGDLLRYTPKRASSPSS
ncbi:F-BAR domain only protein 2 [Nilaparvata lugens]|uniref:F-BAR domain only protein 2 n=1 Tax=Nilaparvata lugens TaxID=108931 RepID=UPI00193E4BCF|nr:F-BAR domain only protein 2 [Nilaparvata lugens]